MGILTFTGRVRSFGWDPPTDKEGNVIPGEPTKMNYITVEFHAPEDEFSDLGAADDPLMLKKPHAVLYLYNMTVPVIREDKVKVYGNVKLSLEVEEA